MNELRKSPPSEIALECNERDDDAVEDGVEVVSFESPGIIEG